MFFVFFVLMVSYSQYKNFTYSYGKHFISKMAHFILFRTCSWPLSTTHTLKLKQKFHLRKMNSKLLIISKRYSFSNPFSGLLIFNMLQMKIFEFLFIRVLTTWWGNWVKEINYWIFKMLLNLRILMAIISWLLKKFVRN